MNGFSAWLDELIELASNDDYDLKLEEFHYRTWFYRGYRPKDVANDLFYRNEEYEQTN